MIEYTITHTFGQFRLIFLTARVKNSKMHFFRHFLKSLELSNLFIQYVYGKVLSISKNNIKWPFYRPKTEYDFFWHLCHFHTFASIEVNFHYFQKRTKMPFSTFQDLSIDILHVKIRPFLRILKKCILLLKKCVFPPFLWRKKCVFALFWPLRLKKINLNWPNVCVIVYSIIT